MQTCKLSTEIEINKYKNAIAKEVGRHRNPYTIGKTIVDLMHIGFKMNATNIKFPKC